MNDFVTLTCPSCGGKLQITNDIEQFVCGHCGNEHIVRRSGGIIAVAPLIEGIKKVQAGTDKTASELGIKRLKEELGVLGLEAKKLILTITGRGTPSYGFFEDFKRGGITLDYHLPVINDCMLEKGIISKKQRNNPRFLLEWNNSDLLFSLSIADFEEIKRHAQELSSKSNEKKKRAYKELIEWCQQVQALMQTIQSKSGELKLHEQRVKT